MIIKVRNNYRKFSNGDSLYVKSDGERKEQREVGVKNH